MIEVEELIVGLSYHEDPFNSIKTIKKGVSGKRPLFLKFENRYEELFAAEK